jgi:hypothetical protein
VALWKPWEEQSQEVKDEWNAKAAKPEEKPGHCTCHPGFIGEHGRDCPMRDTPPTNKQEGLT